MDYSYSTTHTAVDGTSALALGLAFFSMFIIAFISYAITAFLLGRVYQKAGVPQWVAWVPIYNAWKFLELGGQQGFWAILSFVPFLGLISLVFMAIAAYNIGLKLGKEGWFVLVAIFLPLVWLIWLAFDDSKWQGGKSTNAPKASPAKKPAAKKRA